MCKYIHHRSESPAASRPFQLSRANSLQPEYAWFTKGSRLRRRHTTPIQALTSSPQLARKYGSSNFIPFCFPHGAFDPIYACGNWASWWSVGHGF